MPLFPTGSQFKMSTFRAYLGQAGLNDVGLRFCMQNQPIGLRIADNIVDEGSGWYSRGDLKLAGDNVRWDSLGTPEAKWREDLSMRARSDTLRAYLGASGLTDVGLTFYIQDRPLGPRIADDIVDEGDGWYSCGGLQLLGDNVRWDFIGTPDAAAREDLTMRLEMEPLPPQPAPAAPTPFTCAWARVGLQKALMG